MKNAVLFFNFFFPRPFHLLFNNFVYLFPVGCVGPWLLCGLFSRRSAGGGGYSVVGCAGFSLRRRLLLQSTDSGPWLSSGGTRAELPRSVWGPRTRARAHVSCIDRRSLYRRATQGSPSFSSLFFFPTRPLLPFQDVSLVACDRFLSPYPFDPVVVSVTQYHFTITIVNHAILQLELVLCLKG